MTPVWRGAQEGRKVGKAFVDEFFRVLPKATAAMMKLPSEKVSPCPCWGASVRG